MDNRHPTETKTQKNLIKYYHYFPFIITILCILLLNRWEKIHYNVKFIQQRTKNTPRERKSKIIQKFRFFYVFVSPEKNYYVCVSTCLFSFIFQNSEIVLKRGKNMISLCSHENYILFVFQFSSGGKCGGVFRCGLKFIV